jgi:hypothetical protein
MDELKEMQTLIDSKSREFTQLSLIAYEQIKLSNNEGLIYWYENKIKELGLNEFFGI